MITIIVPIFNAEKTIRKCIESVIKQKYIDYELILVDDGSKDNSRNICKEYVNNKIFYYSKINEGVSSARNFGIEKSNGEFIVFLDADDYVEENWLSDYMDNYNGEDMIYQNAIWHKPDGSLFYRKVNHVNNIPTIEYIKMLYEKNTLNFVWAALFKTDIIKRNNIRFDENLKYSEDCDFALRYCKYVNCIKILPSRNYHYILPTHTKNYFLPSLDKIKAIKKVCELGVELTGDKSNDSIFIRKCSDELINTVLMMYKEKNSSDLRISILEKIVDTRFKIIPTTLKFKIVNFFIFKNVRVSNFCLKIIL